MRAAAGVEERVQRLQASGVIDLHFDLPLGLLREGERRGIVAQEFLPDLEAGKVSILGTAIYVEDRYLPERGLEVALAQAALLLDEIEATPQLALCKTFADLQRAQAEGRIGLLLTMEGAEPLGDDLKLLRIFYELGLRAISLTHARVNAAGAGGIFAASGSPAQGLTTFGRELVQECERLGILLDLAHINAAGFEEICALTTRPLLVSHSNARRFHDIERNLSDEQIRMIGARGGVIGVNAILVSSRREEATLDRYVDHMEHIAGLIGIEGVGIGFDFCEFLWRTMPAAERAELEKKLTPPHFIPDLRHHGHAQNLTRKLVERGFSDREIEKILRGNWLRILEQGLEG